MAVVRVVVVRVAVARRSAGAGASAAAPPRCCSATEGTGWTTGAEGCITTCAWGAEAGAGEGAGVVVLEEYEHAKARGAKIYAEVVGYGLSGDAYHVTAPHPEGFGAYRSMEMALKKAGMTPADIDYINAHGTSTMADTIELGAVKRLFGDAIGDVSMSSTKSAIGHLLGGAGAVETIFCILAIRDQIVPPTLNLDNPDEGTEGVDLVPKQAKQREVKAVLNNSFGFGGTNASLILKQVD